MKKKYLDQLYNRRAEFLHTIANRERIRDFDGDVSAARHDAALTAESYTLTVIDALIQGYIDTHAKREG